MSASVVPNSHINAMVNLALLGPENDKPRARLRGRAGIPCKTPRWISPSWYLPVAGGMEHSEIDERNAQDVGQLLWRENVASVEYRYSEHEEIPYLFEWDAWAIRPSVVEGLKVLACYEYQSCEHPGWRASAAYAFCDALRHQLIGRLPGYQDAAGWSWTE